MRLISNMSQMTCLRFCLSRELGKCALCYPTSASVMHVTVPHLILKGVMMTAICKRSFSMCNSLFSGVPIIYICECLEKNFGDGEMTQQLRRHGIYTFFTCVLSKLLLQRIAYK